MSATTQPISFESVAAWLDQNDGREVSAELDNARGITRRWSGRLSRRRTFGLPAARLMLPLPGNERWLSVGGRHLPVVVREQDFAGGELGDDGLTLELGRARLTITG